MSKVQAVVLAGGLGTRLGDLRGDLPKPMLDVNGKPFLEHELVLLRRHGIDDVILCVGHLAEKIQRYFGDGSRLGLQIRYSVEERHLLGTAGAVKKAEPLLDDFFFLTYGDSYLRMDYQAALRDLKSRQQLGVMAVYRNDDRYDRSNVVVEAGLVKAYDKQRRLPGMNYINFGVSALRKEALSRVPAGVPYSQEDWYQTLIGERQLAAFETGERFYETGSPDGLAEFRRLVAEGRIAA